MNKRKKDVESQHSLRPISESIHSQRQAAHCCQQFQLNHSALHHLHGKPLRFVNNCVGPRHVASSPLSGGERREGREDISCQILSSFPSNLPFLSSGASCPAEWPYREECLARTGDVLKDDSGRCVYDKGSIWKRLSWDRRI
ncbi:hypothetical protein AVEN_177506-1 [Araneus ventricosus]|uniref:Uncharacterized protein n=1 Tax=Araneus ventricosus TaxID=182803 RepID=A0A4Y2D0F7_ARAVE|nr:hypothetical protein AVEN_177506-1 [Araneus ventricosus]